MKYLPIAITLAAIFNPLLIPVAKSNPLPAASDFPRVANPAIDEPLCYIQTTSGSTFNLSNLCGRGTPITSPNVVRGNTPNPATTSANPLPASNTSSPNSSTTRIPPPSGSAATAEDDLDTGRRGINLPNVPGSAFNPGGAAPTREAITGPRN